MEKSNSKNGGNTPKLSRKGTKKQTKIGSFVTNIFSRPKKHKENDKKSNEGEISIQSDLPPVNLDDVKETETLTHFDRPRAPNNRRRPARVAARKPIKPLEDSNLNNNNSKEGEIINSSKTDNSINIVEDNKENIISARKSSLPGSLPPVPSKKSRPRLASTTKDTNKSTDDTKEDSIDGEGERLSQKSLTRSQTEVSLEPPAVPPAKLKPRSNSISNPARSSLENPEVFVPRASVIPEEDDEDINGYDIASKNCSEETKPSGRKLTKSKSLCVNDTSKASRKQNKKRALTVGSEEVMKSSIDKSKILAKLSDEGLNIGKDTKSTEIPKTENRNSASQRLSFQGVEYYKGNERQSNSEKKNSWGRAKTVDGSEASEQDDSFFDSASSNFSYNRNSSSSAKGEMVNQSSTEMGSNSFIMSQKYIEENTGEESTCKASAELPHFKKSLDHSNRHSHYCCDETNVTRMSQIIYQS